MSILAEICQKSSSHCRLTSLDILESVIMKNVVSTVEALHNSLKFCLDFNILEEWVFNWETSPQALNCSIILACEATALNV